MNSLMHRANIHNHDVNEVGVGVVDMHEGRICVTQVFAKLI